MLCFPSTATVRSPKRAVRTPGVRRWFGDDRGVATLEGILVFVFLAGVLLTCLLLGQWGTRLQYAQMGARLLTFDAGDEALARFGRQGDQATQVEITETWSAGDLPVDWLNTMFTLQNERTEGSVRGAQRGRRPSQGRSLFDLSPTSLGYHSGLRAASNPWNSATADVRTLFLHISYNVARFRVDTSGIDVMPIQALPTQPVILETIFGRVGVE